MKKTNLIICLVFMLLLSVSIVGAQEKKPVQLALVAPVQLFDENTEIAGIRFNFLYGKNSAVTGLDLGLINHTTVGTSKGVQFGLVGLADDRFVGFQNNFVNIAQKEFEGFQWGFVNHGDYVNGFQLGFVNYARRMKGLQIGLVNIIKQGGQFPVFPIVNWSF